jgi:hypothetical protein
MTTLLVYLFFLHFVADFLLQSREMGKNKSSNWTYLAGHLLIQFSVVVLGTVAVIGIEKAMALSFINAAVHGVIDWHIWRGYKVLAHYRLLKQAAVDATNMPNWNIPYETRKGECYAKRLKEFQYWEDHWFYATIGLDQFLHMTTLVVVAHYVCG